MNNPNSNNSASPEDFEIGNVENFGGVKDQEFSHSSLVQSAMRKCLEAGAKEMREGWFNERTDRQGNNIRTYIEDTRKAFIESVRSLKMIMACDFDKIARDRIKKYLGLIKLKEKELIDMDNEIWNRLSVNERTIYLRAGEIHLSKMISHPTLKKHFIEYELKQWRNIYAELGRLTKRLDFYKAELFEA